MEEKVGEVSTIYEAALQSVTQLDVLVSQKYRASWWPQSKSQPVNYNVGRQSY